MATQAATFKPDAAVVEPLSASPGNYFAMGGVAAWVLLAYSLATMAILFVAGGQPSTAEEAFRMLQENRLVGLLRLDVLSILLMPLYYVLFLSLYAALHRPGGVTVTLATLLVFAGVTLFLATPSAFSWLSLNDRFAAAGSEAQKTQLIAAGEAILASDMWHGSGAMIGGILLQTGTLLISVAMLWSSAFGKFTAWVGIVTHGLDLAHTLVIFASPSIGNMLMWVAGPLYLLWFPLVAWRLFRLARSSSVK